MTLPRAARLTAALLCLALLAARQNGAAAAAATGPLAVSASLEPAEIRVGDVARLTVTVEHPAAGVLTLPELERGKAIREIDRQRATIPAPGAAAAGRERTTFVVSLTSFEVGEHGVGSGTIRCDDPAGQPLAAPFPGTVLRTRSLLSGESTPMRGVREPLRWRTPRDRWIGLAAGALLLAAAILVGARRRKSRRSAPPAAAPVALPPHEAALKALAALRRKVQADRGQVDVHFQELSSIVRGYLEERFGLRAPELTTEELGREAAGSGLLAPAHQEVVRVFLAECDLVKFARHRPSAEDLAGALAAAERLVRETKPPAAPGPDPGKKAA
jgi:hypothetical protein